MAVKLSMLAEQTGAQLSGDGDCLIETVADISTAQPGSIAFVSSTKYKKYLKATQASAVIIQQDLVADCALPALVVDNPRLVHAKIAAILHPSQTVPSGISSQASIAPDASIDAKAHVEAGAIIQSGAKISAGAWVGAGTVIGAGVIIGKNTRIYPNVTLYDGCSVGDDCIIHAAVVIGADGFGFVKEGDSYFKVPQLGKVRIGNNVEIGANTSIDRGALEDTVIEDGVKLDNQIQIGHNVVIGKHTVISAGCCIAGSTRIGHHCLFGGMVGVADQLDITDNVIITGRTLVSRSITEPGSYSSSTPMDTTQNWRKNSARFRQLDDMARRLRKLEPIK